MENVHKNPDIFETAKEGQNPVQSTWERLKSVVLKSGEENTEYEARKKLKKPWVTDQMIDKKEERRKWKNVNREHGKRMNRKLNNEFQRETDRARAVWWEG